MKRVTMDELKGYFPEADETALLEQAKVEGIEVEGSVSPAEEKEEVTEEVKEETVEETVEDDDDEQVDDRTKKGLIAARQKEKEKRRAVEATKNAEIDKLTKQLEELQKQRVPAQPQIQTEMPQIQAQTEQAGYYDLLMDAASEKAKKESGIDKNLSDEEIAAMQFTEPRRYNKYVLAMNTIAQELHQENTRYAQAKNENVQFERELSTEPQYQAIFNYAKEMLDDMPMREARKVDEAAFAFGNHRATNEQLGILRDYWSKAKESYTGAITPRKTDKPNLNVVPTQPSKLDAFANGSRSGEVRGSQSGAISEAELLRMFDDDPVGALDKVPKATLDRYRRG